MSSLRNAIKRVTHKERSQPRSRSHLGLLEKKKDYKSRSDNFHKKERRLKAMGSRADNRNPDEFFMSMQSSEVKDGRHRLTDAARLRLDAEALGTDTVKAMKTQDLKYLRAAVERDRKKETRIRSSLHFDHEGRERKNKRTVFIDGGEVEAREVLESVEFGDDGEGREDLRAAGADKEAGSDDEYDLDLSSLQPKAAPKSEKSLRRERRAASKLEKRLDKERLKSYASLRDRAQRRGKVEAALAFMETERNMSSKGAKRKIKDSEDGIPPIYKWRRKRAK